MKVAVLGCGWFGFPLAADLAYEHVVNGSSRSNFKRLTNAGIIPFSLDLNTANIAPNLDDFFDVDILIFNVPPSKVRNYQAAIELLCDILQMQSGLKRLIHISSTSVYPNNDSKVDETLPIELLKNGGVLQAEISFRRRLNIPVDILRFAGLVGPDRHPATTLSGKNLNQFGNAPVNLVHISDCISITKKLLNRPIGAPETILNVCADNHPTKKEYYSEMARRAGIPAPNYIGLTPDSYKVVSNERSKVMLSYQYQKSNVYDF